MRKRRAVIYDDEEIVVSMFKNFFSTMNYEVVSFTEPIACPIYNKGADACNKPLPCADVVITDFKMPRMTGLELIHQQSLNGCKLTLKNKAVISAYVDEKTREKIKAMGCAFFEKPVNLDEFSVWLADCEQRIDLSQPLACRRRETRQDLYSEVLLRAEQYNGMLKGMTVDISETGLRLKLPVPLIKEQRLWLNPELPLSSRSASVRWVSKHVDGSYLAGLRCH